MLCERPQHVTFHLAYMLHQVIALYSSAYISVFRFACAQNMPHYICFALGLVLLFGMYALWFLREGLKKLHTLIMGMGVASELWLVCLGIAPDSSAKR